MSTIKLFYIDGKSNNLMCIKKKNVCSLLCCERKTTHALSNNECLSALHVMPSLLEKTSNKLILDLFHPVKNTAMN